jgi:hypothetical protein
MRLEMNSGEGKRNVTIIRTLKKSNLKEAKRLPNLIEDAFAAEHLCHDVRIVLQEKFECLQHF